MTLADSALSNCIPEQPDNIAASEVNTNSVSVSFQQDRVTARSTQQLSKFNTKTQRNLNFRT